jgi:hypothetical protein
VYVLNVLGLVALDRADFVQATALFNEGIKLAHVHGHTVGAAESVGNLGLALLFQGDIAQAGERVAESVVLCQQLGNKRYLGLSLTALALITLFQGEIFRAASLVAESLKLLRQVNEKLYMVYCLIVVAGIATARGQFAGAARLLGAADGLREAIGMLVMQSAQPVLQHVIGATQAQLDRATFESAWIAGQAMPLEQAIAYALDQVTPVEPDQARA